MFKLIPTRYSNVILNSIQFVSHCRDFSSPFFGPNFGPIPICKNDQYFPPKWLKIPNLKFLSESEPSNSNTCSRLVSLCRPSYPQIMKVIPKLSITSNSGILYFLYCARSYMYAEEFNHLKLQLCRTENSQFIHVNLLPQKIWRNFLENWLKKLENFVGLRYIKNVGK